ncbi:sulfate transporter CysZ [Larsenimonas suaedae]|uniref:Sulfate transporter CysZ n=1 Tax=Larsenimonas suaedae TaxID=1851019 RepID=A0ABU1GX24_9GAMM|nr:sulfate transporter CysZ [Larsenimonas suaedae]MCM2973194.1 sulfate transporter CysZ [Larsenimonas suaedae]MDR5896087.1 sulfate transporter CysZ [Larsenimonas suaedae]
MLESVGMLEKGLRMVLKPGCRRYVVVPLLLNLVVYSLLLGWLFTQFGGWMDYWMAQVPAWLSWLEWLIWPLVVVSLLIVAFYTFNLFATLIAAPFYGFLAERLDEELTGRPINDPRSLTRQALDSLGRELKKLGYFLPRVAVLVVIGFIPVINVAAPFLWALFSAWSMAIQYLDYPMDLHRVSFTDMRGRLRTKWWQSLTFGGVVTLGLMIPLVNLLMMPAAVAAAVMMWNRHYCALLPHDAKPVQKSAR